MPLLPRTVLPLSIALMCFGVLAGVLGWLFLQLQPASTQSAAQPVIVEEGAGLRTIARRLDAQGLIRSAFAFTVYVTFNGTARAMQAGTYDLDPAADAPTIARILAGGDANSRETVITIPEGWSMAQIGAYLVDRKQLFTREAWDAAAAVTDTRTLLPDATFDFLIDKPATATLEGYLFPDTYRVFKDAPPAEVLAKLLTNFGAKVPANLRSTAVTQDRSFFAVLTLASMVELEVRAESDRMKVADIFLRRLRDGVLLQSDVTVQYAVGRPGVPPTKEDLAVDSPYNTYKYAGLPPGPISNPGLAAIRAALEPEQNEYYYFLNTPTGETIFSRTLEEHNANVAKYLR